MTEPSSAADSSRPRPPVAESSRPRPPVADSSRPRPQYGEYASPEEQSRRAGRPLTPAVAPATTPVAPAGVAPAAEPTAEPGVVVEGARPPHPVDRVAALALLAYGLWNVMTSIGQFLNPATLMDMMLQAVGISGSFSNYDQAKTWGIVACVVLIVGWLATAAWTVVRLRRGRLAWWVPVLGGAVFVTLATICMMVPFFSDPAVVSFLNGQLKK